MGEANYYYFTCLKFPNSWSSTNRDREMIDGDENNRSEPNESLIMDPLSENLLGTVESTANTDIHEKRKRSLAECVVLSVSGFKKPRMSADSGVGEEVEEVVSSPLH